MAKKVDVSVRVQWPSKEAKRKLPQDLESLGKMLVRGTYRKIAHTAWKNSSVQKEITELMRKDIDTGFSPLFEERTEQSSKDKQRQHVVFYYGKSIGGNQGESASVLFTFLGSMHKLQKQSQTRMHDPFWSSGYGSRSLSTQPI